MKYIDKALYLLISIGIFIFIMGFYVKNYNLYFLLIGAGILLLVFVLVMYLHKKEIQSARSDYEVWKEDLIQNGLKIEINLSKIEIKSSNYREEIIDNGYSKYKALDTLSETDNREYNTIKECILVYETQVSEKKFKFFSPIIPKDEITLRFLLNNQKTTFIYQDKTDPGNYFFDIDFLYE